MDSRGPLREFCVVSRTDHLRLFRRALRLRRKSVPDNPPPVLPESLLATLRRNTIGYLGRDNLKPHPRPRRPAATRAVAVGPAGEREDVGVPVGLAGMSSVAVRVPDRHAGHVPGGPGVVQPGRRRSSNSSTSTRRGVVFFDDMDVALRDRDPGPGVRRPGRVPRRPGRDRGPRGRRLRVHHELPDRPDRPGVQAAGADRPRPPVRPADSGFATGTDRAVARRDSAGIDLDRAVADTGGMELRGDRGTQEPADPVADGHRRPGTGTRAVAQYEENRNDLAVRAAADRRLSPERRYQRPGQRTPPAHPFTFVSSAWKVGRSLG